MLKDISLSAVVAGLLAVIIAYAGPLIIVFQVATLAGVSTDMMMSWVWGISMGVGISGIFLSYVSKMPIMTGWSVPGTVLLLSLFPTLTVPEMVGAHMLAGLIIVLIGISGSFDKLMAWIPQGVAGGMLAGLLFQFGAAAFNTIGSSPLLLVLMLSVYLLGKRYFSRYSIVAVFATGLLFVIVTGQLHTEQFNLQWVTPQLIVPEFSVFSILSLSIPLVLVSLSGQYLPGMAILRVDGYRNVKSRPIMVVTGATSALNALTGAPSIVLGAISAAIATGPDSHPNPDKRYIAGISNGVFYIIGAFCTSAIVTLFAVFPAELVAILAGLALMSSINGNIVLAVEDKENREAALLTFIATASGMSFLGLASAFWGIVIGMTAALLFNPKLRAGIKPLLFKR
ncbi:Inner membrane protein ydcO [Oligella ureolytica]|uniref:benzoate/H(+) symporter BenE family transporter n=1 Tax=Oligella ureolytica TaxID=90244 RepID=UPI000DFCF91A|nr:benzoate/H(+) symporter BenE family transporter [Oligella ureolytica]SUA58355.1 Inner membrane protein ydcO [Oligella ureolytica]